MCLNTFSHHQGSNTHTVSNFCVCCKPLWLKQVYCYVMPVQSLCPRCFKITKPYTHTGGIWNFSSSPAAGLSFSTNNMKNLTLPALRWYIHEPDYHVIMFHCSSTSMLGFLGVVQGTLEKKLERWFGLSETGDSCHFNMLVAVIMIYST